MENDDENREAEFSSDDASGAHYKEKRRSNRINPHLNPDANHNGKFSEREGEMGADGEDDHPRPPPPPRSAEEMDAERKVVRSMWELASVFDFFRLFNEEVIKLPEEITADEIEMQILTPEIGNTLTEVHVRLLKHIHPPCRPPVDKANWVTTLAKRFRNHWVKVSDRPCPLPYEEGEERYTYESLSPADRVRILKALCDLRLDQEDIHNHVDMCLKAKVEDPMEHVRLQPVGKDSSGCLYWYPYAKDSPFSYRLYKEIAPGPPPKGKKLAGKRALPVESGACETVAASLKEFQDLSAGFLASKFRSDKQIGKLISEVIVPDLEEQEIKRERALRKQQRQVLQLQDGWGIGGLATGRSRRERKTVSYTFDDYDKSIEEAIKDTRKNRGAEFPQGAEFREGMRDTRSGRRAHAGDEEDTELNGDLGEGPDADGTPPHQPRDTAERSRREDGGGEEDEGRFLELPGVQEGEEEGGSDQEDVDGRGSPAEAAVNGGEQAESTADAEFEKYRPHDEEEDEEYAAEEEEEEDMAGSEEEGSDDYGHQRRSSRNRDSTRQPKQSLGTRRSERSSKSRVNYRAMEDSDDGVEGGRAEQPARMSTRRGGQREPGKYEEMVDPIEEDHGGGGSAGPLQSDGRGREGQDMGLNHRDSL